MPGSRIARTMGPLEWALLITLSILWGGTFFFAEVALEEVLQPPDLVGMALIGFGLAAIDGRPLRLLRRRAGPPVPEPAPSSKPT